MEMLIVGLVSALIAGSWLFYRLLAALQVRK